MIAKNSCSFNDQKQTFLKKFFDIKNGLLNQFGFKTGHFHISVSKADVVNFQSSF